MTYGAILQRTAEQGAQKPIPFLLRSEVDWSEKRSSHSADITLEQNQIRRRRLAGERRLWSAPAPSPSACSTSGSREEHWLKDGSEFKFWRAQREAIEALIYVYEVCRYHNLYSLSRNFGVSLTFDPTTDNWPKYCFKMATGSGKTFVMALAIVWQYFNRFFRTENGCRYTSRFLLIAPNLIVLDRLNEAFEDNAIFQDFPFIPPEWEADFDLQLVYQSQVTAPHAFGTLYLTNVQQLYGESGGTRQCTSRSARPYVVKGQP
jgi:hypothetical protein